MGSFAVRLTVLAAVALTVCAGAGSTAAAPYGQAKKCHWVVKKIHGKRHRVRVCTGGKPKPKPKPVNVSIRLDTAHSTAVTASSADGATASTTSSSGVRATLTVPAGAVESDTKITVTPIASTGKLPLKALIAGVQLEPDGLELAKQATLTIQPASLPAGKLIGFTYSGDGQQVHPYPVSRSGSTLTFRIGHFSGYGAGIEAAAQRAALVGTMLAEWGSLLSTFSVAGSNPSLLGTSVLNRYWAWMAAAQGYGFAELQPYITQLRAQAQSAMRNASASAEASCKGRGVEAPLHALRPVFDTLKAIETARNLGLADIVGPSDEFVLKECLTFEVDFDTTITWTVYNAGDAVSHVRSTRLVLDWRNRWRAEQPLDYVSFSLPQPDGCSMILSPEAEAPFAAGLPRMRDMFIPWPDRDRIALDVDVGRASEGISITCPHAPPQNGTGHFYDGIYVFHDNRPTFSIDDWTFVGEATYATRDYDRSFNAGGQGIIHESTHIVLRHTPR